jgi:hypothetical protein
MVGGLSLVWVFPEEGWSQLKGKPIAIDEATAFCKADIGRVSCDSKCRYEYVVESSIGFGSEIE